MTPDEAITIVTTTCAIPSAPSTRVIDQVYESARKHLPTAKWLVLFDGVHPIQEVFRSGYEEYKKALIARMATGEWPNTAFMEFSEWHHQGGQIREALRQNAIKTPLVLWLEHDFPFNELPIDWQGIVNSILGDEVCYIRFALPEENWISIQALNVPTFSEFVPLMRTFNYSSLPHVCHRGLLERLVQNFVTGRNHLECVETEGIAYQEEKWRLALYTPPGQLDRIFSIDGRAGHPKPAVEV